MLGMKPRVVLQISAAAFDELADALLAAGRDVDPGRLQLDRVTLTRSAGADDPVPDDPIARHRARVLAPKAGSTCG